ncbi:MAG: glycosyltransferase family 4 protein [Alphaproteobacteria bacterium]
MGDQSRALLLYLVTEDWAFCSHRLPTAQGAVDAGFRVAVAARVTAHGDAIRALGYDLHPLSWQRRSLNPFRALRDLLQIAALYRRLNPRIVHHVALKAILLGGLAARLVPVPAQINAVNGVGYIFSDPGLKARLLRLFLVPVLRFVMRRPSVQVWFQNPDDRDLMLRLGIVVAAQCTIIPGSGVDTDQLHPQSEPPDPVTCAYAGRMLRSKGIDLLVAAVQQVRTQGIDLHLLLAGATDDNPTSFPAAQLQEWGKIPGVEYLGHVKDINELWARAHIAVLPCREREGLPKTLLDAAACGRPLIASALEGVREVARDGQNAILIPPGDVTALAKALADLALDPARRAKLGTAGRALVTGAMSAQAIRRQVAERYRTFQERKE